MFQSARQRFVGSDASAKHPAEAIWGLTGKGGVSRKTTEQGKGWGLLSRRQFLIFSQISQTLSSRSISYSPNALFARWEQFGAHQKKEKFLISVSLLPTQASTPRTSCGNRPPEMRLETLWRARWSKTKAVPEFSQVNSTCFAHTVWWSIGCPRRGGDCRPVSLRRGRAVPRRSGPVPPSPSATAVAPRVKHA